MIEIQKDSYNKKRGEIMEDNKEIIIEETELQLSNGKGEENE